MPEVSRSCKVTAYQIIYQTTADSLPKLRAHGIHEKSKAHPPKLNKLMDKKLSMKLNGGRHVQGILQRYGPFMNPMIDEYVEMATSGQQNNARLVVI